MEIAICDDIQQQAEELKKMIGKYYADNTPVHFTIFSSGVQLVERCETSNASFDVFFLDVLMPGIDGLETARMIRMIDEVVPIVFVTSAEQYATLGYDVDAISYLIKPIDQSKINSVLRKIEKKKHTIHMDKPISVVSDGILHKISLRSIMSVEKVGRKVKVHRFNEPPIISNQPMREITTQLANEPGFRICFQSNYVNLRLVKTIDQMKRTITMEDGKVIEVARERMRAVMEEFLFILGDD